MEWFSGSIPEAVAEAKRNNKLFLVYIEGTDDLSKSMTNTYNDASIAQKLSTGNVVALKLTANSVPFIQFCAIYPVLIIPSSYFIGVNGAPIEIVTGSMVPTEFANKIDKIFEVYEKGSANKKVTNSPQASSSKDSEASASPEASSSEPNQPSTSESSNDTTLEENKVPLEDRVERAKALLDAKKKIKEQEEKEREKQQEVERRSVGKALQKIKQEQRDNELKEWALNRAKEKEEERLAREKVRAMIAQDRAERAARYQQSKEVEQAETDRQRKVKEEQERAARVAAFNSNEAHIQFRLPDGSSTNHIFSADATLDDARKFVIKNNKNKKRKWRKKPCFDSSTTASFDADASSSLHSSRNVDAELEKGSAVAEDQNDSKVLCPWENSLFWDDDTFEESLLLKKINSEIAAYLQKNSTLSKADNVEDSFIAPPQDCEMNSSEDLCFSSNSFETQCIFCDYKYYRQFCSSTQQFFVSLQYIIKLRNRLLKAKKENKKLQKTLKNHRNWRTKHEVSGDVNRDIEKYLEDNYFLELTKHLDMSLNFIVKLKNNTAKDDKKRRLQFTCKKVSENVAKKAPEQEDVSKEKQLAINLIYKVQHIIKLIEKKSTVMPHPIYDDYLVLKKLKFKVQHKNIISIKRSILKLCDQYQIFQPIGDGDGDGDGDELVPSELLKKFGDTFKNALDWIKEVYVQHPGFSDAKGIKYSFQQVSQAINTISDVALQGKLTSGVLEQPSYDGPGEFAAALHEFDVYAQHPVFSDAKEKTCSFQHVCQAVNSISDVAQGNSTSGVLEQPSYDEPGEFAVALDEFNKCIFIDPLMYNEVQIRPALEQCLESIISKTAFMVNFLCPRNDWRECIVAECNAVQQAFQDLLSAYMLNAGRKEVSDRLGKAMEHMARKIKDLRCQLCKIVLGHMSDLSLETNVPLLALIKAAKEGNQQEVEHYSPIFTQHASKLVKVANLACSISNDDGVEIVRIAAAEISNLFPQVTSAAHILSACAHSKVAQENMDAFQEAWENQVKVLTEALEDNITIDEFLAFSDNHILQNIIKGVLALQAGDADTLNHVASAIQDLSARVCNVVVVEMDNYMPGIYTEGVLKAVLVLWDKVMPYLASQVELTVEALSPSSPKEVDEKEFIEALNIIYEGVRGIRRAVLSNRLKIQDKGVLPVDSISACELGRDMERITKHVVMVCELSNEIAMKLQEPVFSYESENEDLLKLVH